MRSLDVDMVKTGRQVERYKVSTHCSNIWTGTCTHNDVSNKQNISSTMPQTSKAETHLPMNRQNSFDDKKLDVLHVEGDDQPQDASRVDQFGTELEKSPEGKKLIKKLDTFIMPILFCMYFMNKIDQNAIANARLNSLEKDLALKPGQFNICVSILYVGYTIVQIPSNMLMATKRVRPSIWMSCWMMAWAAISAATAAVTSFQGLFAVRFLLGFAEAPFYPGELLDHKIVHLPLTDALLPACSCMSRRDLPSLVVLYATRDCYADQYSVLGQHLCNIIRRPDLGGDLCRARWKAWAVRLEVPFHHPGGHHVRHRRPGAVPSAGPPSRNPLAHAGTKGVGTG